MSSAMRPVFHDPPAASPLAAPRLAWPWRGLARLRVAWRPPTILIRWKLTLFYSAVLALTLMSFSLAVYTYMDRTLMDDIRRSSQERAAQAADGLLREARRQDSRVMAVATGRIGWAEASLLQEWDELQGSFEPWRYEGVGIRYYHWTGRLVGSSDKFLEDRGHVPIDYNMFVDASRGIDHAVVVSTSSAVVGGPFYSYSRPVFRDHRPWAVVEILTSLQSYDKTMDRLARLLALATILATALAFFTGAAVTEAALRPLDAIARTAQEINQKRDLSRRIADRGPLDEIGRLATTFNDMLDQIQGMFERQRQFLADVSHELRTPLTTIRGEIELMRRFDRLDPEGVDAVHGEAERMARLVEDLLLLARSNEQLARRSVPVALEGIVEDVLRQARVLAGDHHVVLSGDVQPVAVMGDGDHLKQLLLNLVSNALRHTPAGTRVTVGLRRAGSEAELTVADDGPGIPAEDLPFVFDRFYRVDKARARASGGTGLGLSIVHAIATGHGGRVTVTSDVGRGTVFTVYLPQAAPATGRAAAG